MEGVEVFWRTADTAGTLREPSDTAEWVVVPDAPQPGLQSSSQTPAEQAADTPVEAGVRQQRSQPYAAVAVKSEGSSKAGNRAGSVSAPEQTLQPIQEQEQEQQASPKQHEADTSVSQTAESASRQMHGADALLSVSCNMRFSLAGGEL